MRESTPLRITSIDLVRGLIMVLMALDHVRVYSGVPAGGPDPAVFFTRWITHFVAPGFVFLAGTSAYLHGLKLNNKKELSKFLVTRGAWLVLLELTIIRIAWTFNLDFANYLIAGVIWMLGWCMILMAALVHLPLRVNALVGLVIIFAHNVFDFVPRIEGTLWQFLYTGWIVDVGAPLYVLYSIIPWIGVMMLGYAFGAVMTLPAEQRRRTVLRLGLAATAAFLVLRGIDAYGDPRRWHLEPQPVITYDASSAPRPAAPAVVRFLNTTKYPASLSFLLMTLGPILILLALTDERRGQVARVLETFGRVPLFYYLLHIPLIHAVACVVSVIRTGSVDPWLFGNHPMNPGDVPDGYRWSLPLLYLVTLLSVFLLYWPSRWYSRLRASRKHPLLSYL